jgi:predicted amidohydrolase YtcJ
MDAGVLIREAELSGRRVDVRIEGELIAEIEARLEPMPGEEAIEANGGALLPGLHDHHIHLFSLAASLESIPCGPPETCDLDALESAIARAARASGGRVEGLRGAGYFESVAGPLDRELLDRLCPDRPIRIQHRSGSMWFLNSHALDALRLDETNADVLPEGIERDEEGRPTGRLFRLDAWLRERLAPRGEVDLSAVGSLLASRGVTGLTDATPTNGPLEIHAFRKAQASGVLPQRIVAMGSLELHEASSDNDLSVGPYKILLDEPALPDFDRLVDEIRAAHSMHRVAAIHTVTRSEILFAIAALEAAGVMPGDRLEHASVAPPETLETASRLALTIVTQPNFVAERGDAYLADVEAIDLPYLYRLRSWIDAGIALAGGTDAPFGRPDPWRAMRAAVDRQTPSRAVLGSSEALSPERALGLFLTEPSDPGGALRVVAVGRRADLCLLDVPWRTARIELEADHVATTIRNGRVIWARSQEHAAL